MKLTFLKMQSHEKVRKRWTPIVFPKMFSLFGWSTPFFSLINDRRYKRTDKIVSEKKVTRKVKIKMREKKRRTLFHKEKKREVRKTWELQ